MPHPQRFLLLLVFAMAFVFAVWQVLLNNFVLDVADFTGKEIGILQSLREVPGFLAFTAVFVLLILREQRFLLLSLLLLCVGVALTGLFPSEIGLYCTTVLMSIGFHYFETMNKSLTLQWVDKKDAPHFLGRALSIKAVGSLSAYSMIYLAMEYFGVGYTWVYLAAGALGLLVLAYVWLKFENFPQKAAQHKTLILRKRYWLYYVLVFLSGSRRQIFIVFAGFMMVEKFGYSVGDISALFIFNYIFNFLFAAKIGKLIGAIGERRALIIEYVGLILVFGGYAFVDNGHHAAVLYVLDHLFFAFAIAIHTYFQKIAADEDIASTASVSFTINHIAAVVVPALLGMVWLVSPSAVFLTGASFALLSLVFSLFIPTKPAPGNESQFSLPKVGLEQNPRAKAS